MPPQVVRAARITDEYNGRGNRKALQYQKAGWSQFVVTQIGPEPMFAVTR